MLFCEKLIVFFEWLCNFIIKCEKNLNYVINYDVKVWFNIFVVWMVFCVKLVFVDVGCRNK